MSVLQLWAFLSVLAVSSLSFQLGLDSEQKEYVMEVIRELIENAKNGVPILPDTVRDFNLGILPEDQDFTDYQYQSLQKPTLIFHKDGHVSVVDTDKGEQVELVSATGVLNEEIFAKIFNSDFVHKIEEMKKKKEFMAKKMEKMRKEAMKTNRDITETILGKKFVFNNNGAVVLESSNGSVISEFDRNFEIDEVVIGGIFPEAAIETVEIITEKMPPVGEERERQTPPSGEGRVTLSSSILVCALTVRVFWLGRP